MSFPRYPNYKDSRTQWIGTVPAHWNAPKKIQAISSLKGRLGWQGLKADEYREEGSYVVSSAHFADQRIQWDECPRVSEKRYEIDDNIQLCQGDVLLMKDGAAMGKLAFVDDLPGPACLNSHLLLFRPVEVDGVCTYWPKFLFYFLQTGYFQEYIKVNGTGATFLGISQASIGAYEIVLPAVSEQREIADFLDSETAKIDALVAEQRHLIELLKEKRQAVISHAVAKGLDPHSAMKDSGIEWLSEVPAHWKVGKCGFYVSILSGFAFPSTGFSESSVGTKLLRGINVGVGQLRWDETVYWQRVPEDGLDEYELRIGDLVIGMDRPLISEGMRVARVQANDLPCLLLQRVAKLKADCRLDTDYLFNLLSSEMFVAHFSPDTTGVSVPHISPEQICNFVVPIPPIEEQREIVKFIAVESLKSDTLIKESREAIDLLQERRRALVSAAVTGQIDVRQLAEKQVAA